MALRDVSDNEIFLKDLASTAVVNDGIVKYAGTIGTGRPFTASDLSLGTHAEKIVGVVPVSNYTERAISTAGNRFAGMTAEQYVMKHVSTELAGLANTTLQIPATESANHSIASIKTKGADRILHDTEAWREGHYNAATNTYDAGYPRVFVSGMWNLSEGVVASVTGDTAGSPTLATPGRFSYKHGAPNPVLGRYEAKNGSSS